MKNLLINISYWFIKIFNIFVYTLKKLTMQEYEYYVEYQFQTIDFQKEFLFPLFTLAETKNNANLISNKIIKELSTQFILNSVTPLKAGFNQLVKGHYREKYGLHIDRNKVVNLNIKTYQFNDFEPSPTLTFNENIYACIEQNFPNQKDIAKSIFEKKYPVRVLTDKTRGLSQFEDYLLINIGI
jgi:hypothetical protein